MKKDDSEIIGEEAFHGLNVLFGGPVVFLVIFIIVFLEVLF